jgi:hypothetical protein
VLLQPEPAERLQNSLSPAPASLRLPGDKHLEHAGARAVGGHGAPLSVILGFMEGLWRGQGRSAIANPWWWPQGRNTTREFLEEQARSELSVTAFATKVGASAGTLYSWRRRLAEPIQPCASGGPRYPPGLALSGALPTKLHPDPRRCRSRCPPLPRAWTEPSNQAPCPAPPTPHPASPARLCVAASTSPRRIRRTAPTHFSASRSLIPEVLPGHCAGMCQERSAALRGLGSSWSIRSRRPCFTGCSSLRHDLDEG